MKKYSDYVFGYGSIVDPGKLQLFLGRENFGPADYCFCRLPGYRRIWNVAMDNRVDISGYKYYLDKRTKLRPNIFVAFLNVYPSARDSIAGLLFGVSAAELKRLDSRERNYLRVNVETKIEQPVAGRVWLYTGQPAARRRFQEGLRRNNVVISKQYDEAVRRAFAAFGRPALKDYLATTDKPDIPLRALRLVQT